jgi:hypothetical protein
MPAVKAEQLNCDISRGIDMWRVIGGSLSMIMSTCDTEKGMEPLMNRDVKG